MNQQAQHRDPEIDGHERHAASPRRALQRCMRQLVQTHLAALSCQDVLASDRAGVLVTRLARLQNFLNQEAGQTPGSINLANVLSVELRGDAGEQVGGTALDEPANVEARPEVGVAAPSSCARLVPDSLAELLRWQIRLELAELAAQAPELSLCAALLRPLLQQQLEAIERLCTDSAWTLGFFVSSGLARHWSRVHMLARFCPAQSARAGLAGLEANCLWLHLHGSAPAADCKAAMLHEIALRAGQPFAQGLEQNPATVAGTVGLQSRCPAELSQYRQVLAAILAGSIDETLEPAEQLLTVLYKLTWVSEACGQGASALAWWCGYQLCCEFWFQHCALPSSVISVLKTLLKTTAAEDPANAPQSSGEPVWLCQMQLLQQWPADLADTALPIALNATSADLPRVVSLDTVPLLLSASFATLVEVSAEWFATRVSCSADLTPLLQELALLEKGAAAVKVWPLEQLCTLLLELYALVDRDGMELPVDLLVWAHADLVLQLDQAAAWRQATVDSAVIEALQQWIGCAAQSSAALTIAAPTPAEVGASQLYQALQVYVRTLTLVVEKPVRLYIDPDNEVLPQQVLLQIAEALKPLLRFVLLDNASAAYLRRAAHKPLVHTLSIHVRREAGALWVVLEEDSEGPLPTPAQTRQLQRALPPAAGALACEVHQGQGRWFSFTLAEVSK